MNAQLRNLMPRWGCCWL